MEQYVEWAYQLHGRSGVGMAGVVPVSYREIESWQRLMDIGHLEPHEVEALVLLDMALFEAYDREGRKEEEPESKENVVTGSWPKPKEA